MTDENLPPVPPEPSAAPVPPAPPAASVPPAAPAAPAAAPYAAPAAGGVKQGLSLTSFILGIGGIVFSWVFIFGLLVSIAAIILAVLARKRELAAPKWMWLTGLILGIVGAVISVIVLVFWIGIFALAASGNYSTY